uniref:Uncharacterized protein n=1 Tax=Magallana gigas TaxID=29159 RepID=A0A8W8IFH5_MAGGI
MSASMMIARHGRRFLPSVTQIQSRCINYTMSGFHLLLPDVSDDTPETNPLLRYHDMPDFNIPPDKVITGTAKLSQDYEVELLQHLKICKDSTEPPTFESVIDPLENARVPLYYSLYTGRQLGSGKAGRYFDAYKKTIDIAGQVESERWYGNSLYKALLSVRKQWKSDRSSVPFSGPLPL